MDHARFSGAGTLNDGDLVRIWFFGSWDCINIREQKSMVVTQVTITPSGLQGCEIGLAKSKTRGKISKNLCLGNRVNKISCHGPQQMHQLRTGQFYVLVGRLMVPFCYNLAVVTNPNKRPQRIAYEALALQARGFLRR